LKLLIGSSAKVSTPRLINCAISVAPAVSKTTSGAGAQGQTIFKRLQKSGVIIAVLGATGVKGTMVGCEHGNHTRIVISRMENARIRLEGFLRCTRQTKISDDKGEKSKSVR
jgi:hypothetical protein